jgi:hypothetical protein
LFIMMKPNTSRKLRYGGAAAATALLVLSLEHALASPPKPTEQAVFEQSLYVDAQTGMRTGVMNIGDLSMRIVTGDIGPEQQASPQVEEELLTSAFHSAYAAAGYIDPATKIPFKLRASVACGTALANIATRKELLSTDSQTGVQLAFNDGMHDAPNSGAATKALGQAYGTCKQFDLGALTAGTNLMVITGPAATN